MKYKLPQECPYNKGNFCIINLDAECNYTKLCDFILEKYEESHKEKDITKQTLEILESWLK